MNLKRDGRGLYCIIFVIKNQRTLFLNNFCCIICRFVIWFFQIFSRQKKLNSNRQKRRKKERNKREGGCCNGSVSNRRDHRYVAL